MNYAFSNLLGAPYRGGNLVIHDNHLFSPVGNRVSQVDLAQSISLTLPHENLKQVCTVAISPDGTLLLSIDEDGRGLLINRKRNALLHHFSFKGRVAVAKFSPDGRYLAVGVGRLVQVWHTPSKEKQMSPWQLHRTYGQCHSDVLDLDWSPDSLFLAVASKDITLRVLSLNPIPGYEPPTLGGHKDHITGVFFLPAALAQAAEAVLADVPVMYSLSSDGTLLAWRYEQDAINKQNNLAAPAKKRALKAAKEAANASKRNKKQLEKDAGSQQTEQEQEEEEQKGASPESGHEGDDDGSAERRRSGSLAGPSSSAIIPASATTSTPGLEAAGSSRFPHLAGGKWILHEKHYFNQRGARVSSYDFHAASGMLCIGFTNGVFDLYQLPDFSNVHTLSIGRQRISSVAFNQSGDWIAVGCAKLGQLLVWEWRSETYVLKQQGHYFDISAVTFSPDGSLIATGADDTKVKVYQASTGFCFVTFTDHTAPITGLAFLPSGHALISASLDGTVRAYDLVRYRNFRTMTTPEPVQFGSLAVDPSGEVVCAGSLDTFQIYVWSVKTGRLLDVLAGHEGPVSHLSFSPGAAMLASSSWDKTVQLWDVFNSSSATDLLRHSHDVLAVAFRPDGKQLAASTLNGDIYLWDPLEAALMATIEGRRDVRGGRLAADRRAAGNMSSGAAFTSLAYSADGSWLLAAGASKYVCIYDVVEKVMLRRFQVTTNRSLDGVLDILNSKNLTDAGPLQLIDHEDKDDEFELLPVGANAVAAANMPGAPAYKRAAARVRALSLAPTGRSWAAATTEGLLLYSVDDNALFDPTDLAEDLTPAACHAALAGCAFVRALLIALRLRDTELTMHVVLSTPPSALTTVSSSLPKPSLYLPQLLALIAEAFSSSAHVEFLLRWVQALALQHGELLKSSGSGLMPVLRSLQKALGRLHGDLAELSEGNMYTLEYLGAVAAAAPCSADGEGSSGDASDEESDE